MKAFAVALIASLLTTVAVAEPVVDQEQPNFDPDGLTLHIGGDSEQILAQTFRAGRSGLLTQIQVPVGCSSGTLIVEIVTLNAGGTPGTTVLGSESIPAASLPEFPTAFETIVFDPPVDVVAGGRYAIVLRNPTGSCGIARPPDGDSYTRGDGYVDARPARPGWQELSEADPFDDLPFKTFIDRPSGPGTPEAACDITGPLIIPRWVPVCRCLADTNLRSQRCALLDPSLFLFRRIPWPLRAGQRFKVQWTVVPLTTIDGPLEIVDRLPPGFRTRTSSVVFPAGQLTIGKSITLEYEAVAGTKAGDFNVETALRVMQNEETMRSVIEVTPRR